MTLAGLLTAVQYAYLQWQVGLHCIDFYGKAHAYEELAQYPLYCLAAPELWWYSLMYGGIPLALTLVGSVAGWRLLMVSRSYSLGYFAGTSIWVLTVISGLSWLWTTFFAKAF
ncbi:MAG TPA: hypothetical protein VLA88_02850 [Candidatus Saccharimonadales bacterium]|nr:hypothetical protein [Candidatus Saccharimonadales bacterium]